MVRQTVVLLINDTDQDCQGVLNVCSFSLLKDKLYYIDHSGWVSVSCQSGPNVSVFVHLLDCDFKCFSYFKCCFVAANISVQYQSEEFHPQ